MEKKKLEQFKKKLEQRQQELRRTVSQRLGVPAVIRDNPAGQIRQVRVGEFDSREEAQAFVPIRSGLTLDRSPPMIAR